MRSDRELHRFTYAERLVHWVVGVTFVVLLLSGFAFSYPSLFWLTTILGGGTAARVLHPWIGVLFSGGLVAMFFLWVRDMPMRGRDWQWMKAIRHYALHNREKVPDTGKYNGGQKLFFWTQIILGLVFIISGLVLWFPGGFDRGLLATARFLHYLAALGGGLFLIVHIYLGTVAYPGTARSMLQGTVTRAWARLHHPHWAEEEAER